MMHTTLSLTGFSRCLSLNVCSDGDREKVLTTVMCEGKSLRAPGSSDKKGATSIAYRSRKSGGRNS